MIKTTASATLFVLSLVFGLLSPSFEAIAEEVIQKESANDSRSLRPFTVKDGWEVRWEATDRIAIWLNDPKGNPISQAASHMKAGSGQSYQAKGGTYFLSVVGSTTTWTIMVVQLP